MRLQNEVPSRNVEVFIPAFYQEPIWQATIMASFLTIFALSLIAILVLDYQEWKELDDGAL